MMDIASATFLQKQEGHPLTNHRRLTMLKKEMITGLLIAIFSLSLTGIAFADHGGHSTIDPLSSIEAEQSHMAKVEVNTPHRGDNMTGKKTSASMNCDNDLVISTEEFTSDYCRDLYADIYRN